MAVAVFVEWNQMVNFWLACLNLDIQTLENIFAFKFYNYLLVWQKKSFKRHYYHRKAEGTKVGESATSMKRKSSFISPSGIAWQGFSTGGIFSTPSNRRKKGPKGKIGLDYPEPGYYRIQAPFRYRNISQGDGQGPVWSQTSRRKSGHPLWPC